MHMQVRHRRYGMEADAEGDGGESGGNFVGHLGHLFDKLAMSISLEL